MAEHHVARVKIGIAAGSKLNDPDRRMPCLLSDRNGHTRFELAVVFPLIDLGLVVNDCGVRIALFSRPAYVLRETRADETRNKNYCYQSFHDNSLN